MKKPIRMMGIALVLALIASLCFGGVALADDPPDGGVFTHWDFEGEGSIEINTTDGGSVGSFDHFTVQTYGGGSEGWASVNTYSSGSWDTISERGVSVEDGYIQTNTLRDDTGTEYGAFLNVSSEGTLHQVFRNNSFVATYLTEMWADGSTMDAWTQHPDHYFFGIYADGSSSSWLRLYTINYAEDFSTSCNGTRFGANANGSVGILAEWANRAYIEGYTGTPELGLDFLANISGSGDFTAGATGNWVIIDGFVKKLF